MFELIIALVILVLIPILFHRYIVSRYYSIDKEVFSTDNVGSEEDFADISKQ